MTGYMREPFSFKTVNFNQPNVRCSRNTRALIKLILSLILSIANNEPSIIVREKMMLFLSEKERKAYKE